MRIIIISEINRETIITGVVDVAMMREGFSSLDLSGNLWEKTIIGCCQFYVLYVIIMSTLSQIFTWNSY